MRFFNFIKRGLILALSFLREIFKGIEKMIQFQPIEVKDLQNASTLSNTASILALTDATNNTVNLVSKNDFSDSLVSSTANNGLSNDENGLYVPNIGNLSDLDTTDKSSIVDAINEVVETQKQPITTMAAASGTISLNDNTIYNIIPVANITFSLPTISNNNYYHQILIQLDLSTVYQLNLGTTYYFNGTEPSFVSGHYDIIYSYDRSLNRWVCGAIYKGQA